MSEPQRQTPVQPRPKLPVPKVRPAHEKLASVPFVPVEDFFLEGDRPTPSTEIERLQQQLKRTDDMGRLVCNRIRAAYDLETRRIAAEAAVGEKMLQEHGIQSGAWEVEEKEANQILNNMQAEPRPGIKYRKGYDDFELGDEAGRRKPNNYAARINEVLLQNILEGDSNVSGFKHSHMPKIRAADGEALRLAQLRESVERQVQQENERGYRRATGSGAGPAF